LGAGIVVFGIKRMLRSFVTIFLPEREKDLVDIVYQKRQLSKGYRMVVVGGGTGLSVLLSGIKKYTSNITAVVTVTDDGGSSGKLSTQFDTLPPGDIRNCLVALADAEPLMKELFQFRFTSDSDLGGHNFGNLFILAMSRVTGDFEKAIKESSKVLAIRGQVIPSTLRKVTLIAEHADGTKTFGEARISRSTTPVKKLLLTEECKPTAEALETIRSADCIILGPGSLYTSVIANLLVNGIPEAIAASRAPKIYVCNVMTQGGETNDYTASDHVRTLLSYAGSMSVDYCIVNTAPVPEEFLEKYRQENAHPVAVDRQRFDELGVKLVEGEIISAVNHVRHDSDKLAKIIIDLLNRVKKR
jgi:uncharacterized cofD-like protein